MNSAGSSREVRFDQFVLDPGTRELRRGAELVHLTPKAFDLLALLIEQRPRAVAKAAIHEHLWPRTFVADSNLAVLVAELRAALGDAPRRPMFIRTVHGFGYAFCASAETPSQSEAQALAASICWLIPPRQRVSLHDGENIVGRHPKSDVWIDAHSVSRRHARIHVAAPEATLEDLGSRNGTWLKDDRIQGAQSLQDGDRIRFGSVPFTFRVWSDGGSTGTIED
jgi:DNA-binding winged helix-turn-helix (wHTH) protein